MTESSFLKSPHFRRLINSLSKRVRIVVQHIQEHGHITTEEIEQKYGYKHPPRAVRDVRESGIPLTMYRVKSSDGRSIGAYKFGDLSKVEKDKLGGRNILPKNVRKDLYEANAGKCYICLGDFAVRYLQTDHRIPYEVAGDVPRKRQKAEYYMLVCGSCNRAKSWSCEHCPNWSAKKSKKICASCYWASPEGYTHMALREVKRVDILWEKGEVKVYEKLKREAEASCIPIPDYVKRVIARHLENGKGHRRKG